MDYHQRVDALAAAADSDRADFEAPAEPPDRERARSFLREGFGPAVSIYLEARTGGGEFVHFSPERFERLEAAMNTYLELYVKSFGVEYEPEFTVREAAEIMIRTENAFDTARVLTKVPDRDVEL